MNCGHAQNQNNFLSNSGINLNEKQIFFETSKQDKIERIKKLNCTHYIDDLPEILKMISNKCKKILYDPKKTYKSLTNISILRNWANLEKILHY